MTGDMAVKRSDHLLYLVSIALSVPSIISLLQRQFGVPVAGEIEQLVTGYRSLSDAVATVVHAPLMAVSLPPAAPLIDLQILSFAGMGMMTKAMQRPGEKFDWMGGLVWGLVSFVCGYLLVGILVIGAVLALIISKPLIAFRSDHFIETTPILEGLHGRLRREREMRLERDLARIMLITLLLVGAYFGVNALLL
ncbi:MAG: hypothetical protein EON61_08695 [Alphaproteobacteria bacterium]|jgi:hypothetical protein|nr:MAG: hypothetical protein EON61_08695 [Alphaproteobacteria bacterium]